MSVLIFFPTLLNCVIQFHTLIFFQAGRPGSTICFAIRSQSTIGTPNSRNIEAVVLFPVPTPPVKPTRNIFIFAMGLLVTVFFKQFVYLSCMIVCCYSLSIFHPQFNNQGIPFNQQLGPRYINVIRVFSGGKSKLS